MFCTTCPWVRTGVYMHAICWICFDFLHYANLKSLFLRGFCKAKSLLSSSRVVNPMSIMSLRVFWALNDIRYVWSADSEHRCCRGSTGSPGWFSGPTSPQGSSQVQRMGIRRDTTMGPLNGATTSVGNQCGNLRNHSECCRAHATSQVCDFCILALNKVFNNWDIRSADSKQ